MQSLFDQLWQQHGAPPTMQPPQPHDGVHDPSGPDFSAGLSSNFVPVVVSQLLATACCTIVMCIS